MNFCFSESPFCDSSVVDFFSYFRAGSEIYRQAQVYLEEGDLENAFILFMRFLTLFLDKIKNHPQINEISDTLRKTNKEKLLEAMAVTEDLKKRILKVFERENQQSQIDKENTVNDDRKNNDNDLGDSKETGNENSSPKPIPRPRKVFFEEPKKEENRIQHLKEDLPADD